MSHSSKCLVQQNVSFIKMSHSKCFINPNVSFKMSHSICLNKIYHSKCLKKCLIYQKVSFKMFHSTKCLTQIVSFKMSQKKSHSKSLNKCLKNCHLQWYIENVVCPPDICINSNTFCVRHELGDGTCQDHNNGPLCDYDHGDCCLPSRMSKEICQCCNQACLCEFAKGPPPSVLGPWNEVLLANWNEDFWDWLLSPIPTGLPPPENCSDYGERPHFPVNWIPPTVDLADPIPQR